jgi:RimJ/RimL family protein N-acetyltransferase
VLVGNFRLETERLVLRSWRADDLEPFHAINADPEVMATLGPVMSRDEVAALIARMEEIEGRAGHCFWALERRSDASLIGWCGAIPGTVGPIAGKPEIGWRMARQAWGQGYATEAAHATLDWLFANRPDDAAWAITSTGNRRSRAVMERLGMSHCLELDFDHPSLAEGDPLRPHVAYRLDRADRISA